MWTTSPSLLERLQAPDHGAWEKFVDMYTPLFVTWTSRLRLSDHDAADMVQDLFALLVEKLPQFRYDQTRSFRAWLKTILLNRWRNWQRKKAVQNQRAGGSALEDVADEVDLSDFEEEEYRKHLVRRALELMQAEFEPATWKACWEYVVQDRPAAEVAQELGLTINAVYLAKSRVLRRLREELAGLLD